MPPEEVIGCGEDAGRGDRGRGLRETGGEGAGVRELVLVLVGLGGRTRGERVGGGSGRAGRARREEPRGGGRRDRATRWGRRGEEAAHLAGERVRGGWCEAGGEASRSGGKEEEGRPGRLNGGKAGGWVVVAFTALARFVRCIAQAHASWAGQRTKRTSRSCSAGLEPPRAEFRGFVSRRPSFRRSGRQEQAPLVNHRGAVQRTGSRGSVHTSRSYKRSKRARDAPARRAEAPATRAVPTARASKRTDRPAEPEEKVRARAGFAISTTAPSPGRGIAPIPAAVEALDRRNRAVRRRAAGGRAVAPSLVLVRGLSASSRALSLALYEPPRPRTGCSG